MRDFYPTLGRVIVFHAKYREKTGSGLLYRPHSEDFTLDGAQWVWVYKSGPACELKLPAGSKVMIQDGMSLSEEVPDAWEFCRDREEFKSLREMEGNLGLTIQTRITWENRFLAVDEPS